MPERIVYWRALADFSKVRSEARKTQQSIRDLNEEVDNLNESNAELGASEDRLANKTRKNSDGMVAAASKVAKARKEAAKAARGEADAYKVATDASARERLEIIRNTRAKAQEAEAAGNVTTAEKSLRSARAQLGAETKRVARAERDLQKTLNDTGASERGILAAESKLETARNVRTRAAKSVAKAEEDLAKAQQRQSKVTRDNALEAAKAASEFEKAEQKRAQAVEDMTRREAAARERQDRLDARLDKQIRERADARDRHEAELLAKKQARDQKEYENTIRQTTRIMAEMDRLTAAEAAANAARRFQAPDRSVSSDLTTRIQRVRSAMGNTPSAQQTSSQVAADTALTRAENALSAARQNEIGVTDRLNQREVEYAVAKSNAASASAQARSAEADLNDIRKQEVGYTTRVAEADQRYAAAKRDLVKAEAAERVAMDARNRALHTSESAANGVVNAENRLAAAVHRSEREFIAAGGGGNIFTRSLRTMEGWFDRTDSALSRVGRSLHSIRWPAIAGGVYLLVAALSSLVTGLFELASAVAPAVGALAAALPVTYALGGALLSLKAAFSGVGNTLKAYSTMQRQQIASSGKVAKQSADNADMIKSAQDRLREAQQNVGVVARAGAQQVADASRTISDALQSETEAQQRLNQARVEAKQNIIDLKNAAIDAALAERGAALDLADAQASLQQTLNDPNATAADIARARLQVQQAGQGVRESRVSRRRTDSQSDQATRRGVGGNRDVISAKRDLENATRAVTKAEREYRDSLAEASRNNAKAIRAVTSSQRALVKAKRDDAMASNSAATAAANYQGYLQSLSPAAQAFVKKLISMRHYWTELKAVAAKGLFPGLTKALDDVPKLFPVIRSGVYSISKVLGNLGKQFADMITTPRWISAFRQLNDASTPILKNIGDAVLHLMDALRAIAVAAIPLAKKLTKGFDGWAKSIDKAASAGERSGKMQKFFQRTYHVLHQLGQIMKNIGRGFYNMGVAAHKSGQSILNSIQRITKKWADWTGSVKGQNYLKKYFHDARQNMRYVDHLLGGLVDWFVKLGASKSFRPIVKGLADIGSAIREAFAGNHGELGKAFVALLHEVANTIRTIAKSSDGFSVFVKTVTLFLRALNGFLRLPGVGTILGVYLGAFAAFKALKLFGVIKVLEKLGGALRYVAGGFKRMGAEAAIANTAVGTTGAASAAGTGAASAAASGGAIPAAVLASGKAGAVKGGAAKKSGNLLSRIGAGLGTVLGIGGKGAAGAAEGEVAAGSKAGPYGIAAAALAAALTIAYLKVKWFHDGVNKFFGTIWKVIGPVFRFMVSSFKELGSAFSNLWTALKPVVDLFRPLMGLLKPLLPVLKVFGFLLGVGLLGPIGALITTLTALAAILGVVARALTWAINTIIVPTIHAMGAVLKWVWGVAKTVWNAVVKIFKVAVRVIKDIVEVGFKVVAAVILAPIAALVWIFKKIWDKIGGPIKFFFRGIKDFLVGIWGSIESVAKSVWQTIGGAITTPIKFAFTVVKSAWNTFWGWLKSAWGKVKDVAGAIWSAISDTIANAFRSTGGTLGQIWQSIENIFISAINFITQDIINKLISAINWVITKFGIDPIHKIGKIQANAPAPPDMTSGPVTSGPQHGGAFAKGGVLPGYSPGRDIYEFVHPTSGMRIGLSGGEGILVPEAVRALGGKAGIDAINASSTSRLSSRASFHGAMRGGAFASGGVLGTADQRRGYENWAMWRFAKKVKADGSGSVLGDIGGAITGGIGKVVGWARKGLGYMVKKSFEAAEAPIRLLIDNIPGGISFLPKLVNGLFDKVNSGVAGVIAGTSSSSDKKRNPTHIDTGEARYSGIISGAAARGDIMKSGLILNNYTAGNATPLSSTYGEQVKNRYPSLMNALSIIIGNESGWNAGITNLTDINALLGHPSKGLMQLIDSNYAAYKNPNMDRGTFDAISNVTAGVGYSNSRYGTLDAVPGVRAVRSGHPYIGYHTGGVVPGVNKHSSNAAISGILAQSGIAFPQGASSWRRTLSDQFRKRLRGVDRGHDISHFGTAPNVQGPLQFDSPMTQHLLRWVDEHDPKNYSDLWQRQPYGKSSDYPNQYHRNPLAAIRSYVGNPKGWEQYRVKHDEQVWKDLARTDTRKAQRRSKRDQTKVEATSKGFANMDNVKKWLRNTVDHKPYVFGAVGPDAYDCSGLVGEVWARLTHHPSYRRYFSTMNEAKFFDPGKGDGVYTIGYTNDSTEEHTAGRLDGLKFEARGTADGIIVGNNARNPESFAHVMHLPAHKIPGVKKAEADKQSHHRVTVANEKKMHPKLVKALRLREKQWGRDVGMLQNATGRERGFVDALRARLGLHGHGNNRGLFSNDMQQDLDHAAAHALGVSHPANWQHDWSGPVTAAEQALAQSDRANALNAEFYKDLNILATWGFEDLVTYLLDKGLPDGLTIARSAVKDKKTARQLNDSIHVGTVSAGVNADDRAMILKIIAKLGSGTKRHPFGLRDVAADLNQPDYVPVNLFSEMTKQLKQLPKELTSRFKHDVHMFREGLFYANRGAVVPGDMSQNRDIVPAMLTPGEGVLSRVGMAVLGEKNLHRANAGLAPQMFANGGLVLSPNIPQLGLGDYSTRSVDARNVAAGKAVSNGGDVILNTNIYNPSGESSVYSQNKMLQRQAAVGTVAKVAGR